ncbi:MAG: ABC-ATPase domain-containing protein [Gemmatimonadota bacterium]|nr:ABC-ATPase domain-containing protein [Gemmatimonadota bacterium]MDP6803596.1 ABC-ATPase domain-containing protein [Gemmatimonadota bacterium]MDP7032572.1 ABC-ATPase domain-containing protein [Gemmatimonadota bacterium]
MPRTSSELDELLRRSDGRGYRAYRDIRGRWQFHHFTLHVDHVQGDPFASPSRVRVRVDPAVAALPGWAYEGRSRRVGLENLLARQFARGAASGCGRRGSGKSGLVEIDTPGQEVLSATATRVEDTGLVEARFLVGLPAAGRRVLGREAWAVLGEEVPRIVEAALSFPALDEAAVRRAVETNEDAEFLRAEMVRRGCIAFVADGSVLPRRSGVDERPLSGEAVVPFQSPESLRETITLPNAGEVRGMAVPAGVTLIVGGGFHGKSTLLEALKRGVYNHRPGDGRERVVTDSDAVAIRAEDGRRVEGADISPFIRNLPFGRGTEFFRTENASGSTSQAANIVEALELGARALLVDEDTAATNFMIRDRRMQQLISAEKEPITPFIDRVRALHRDLGVSTVLVIGGCGDYFDEADTVIAMENYAPADVTARAKAIAAEMRAERESEDGGGFGESPARRPDPDSIDPRRGRREVSVKTRGWDTICFGEETMDLSSVEQIVDASQTRAIADALLRVREFARAGGTVAEVVDAVMEGVAADGLDFLGGRKSGGYAEFRRYELAAALNRLRSLRAERPSSVGAPRR